MTRDRDKWTQIGTTTNRPDTERTENTMTMNLIRLTKFGRGRIALPWRRHLVAGALCALAMLSAANAQSVSLLYSNHAGKAPQSAVATLPDAVAVTAVCNGSGKLEVIVWQAGTALVRKGSHTSASTCQNSVAITPLNSTTVITANADSAGDYELAAWKVSSKGAISQLGTTTVTGTGAAIQYISIAQLDSTQVVTASVNASHALHVTSWLVSSTGDITMEGDASPSGAFGYTSIAGLNSSQVVTASSETTSADLDVIAWSIDSTGTVTQQGDATAGAVTNPQIALWSTGTVLTAFSNGSGDLELISWTVSSAGDVTRQYTGKAGTASSVALCVTTGSEGGAFTAVAGGGSDLDLETWTSKLVQDFTDNTTSQYTPTSCANIPGAGGAVTSAITTAYADSGDDLEVAVWEVSGPPPSSK